MFVSHEVQSGVQLLRVHGNEAKIAYNAEAGCIKLRMRVTQTWGVRRCKHNGRNSTGDTSRTLFPK